MRQQGTRSRTRWDSFFCANDGNDEAAWEVLHTVAEGKTAETVKAFLEVDFLGNLEVAKHRKRAHRDKIFAGMT